MWSCVTWRLPSTSHPQKRTLGGRPGQAPPSPHLALMRYWARLMLAGVPVMVIWRSDDPSVALAILICAPDICRISLILVPWRPINKLLTNCLLLWPVTPCWVTV